MREIDGHPRLGAAVLTLVSAGCAAGPASPAPEAQPTPQAVAAAPDPAPSERWYRPVDIGQHLWADGVADERLTPDDFRRLFTRAVPEGPPFTKEGEQRFSNLLARRRVKTEAPKDPHFRALDGPWSVVPHEFSRSQVKLDVLYKAGVSRWHHYYWLVARYVIDRDAAVDELVGLRDLDAIYTRSYHGVAHGDLFRDVVGKLGAGFYEYPGQSPSYRQVYYDDVGLEIVIQDGIVKIVRRERPGWMNAGMAIPPQK